MGRFRTLILATSASLLTVLTAAIYFRSSSPTDVQVSAEPAQNPGRPALATAETSGGGWTARPGTSGGLAHRGASTHPEGEERPDPRGASSLMSGGSAGLRPGSLRPGGAFDRNDAPATGDPVSVQGSLPAMAPLVAQGNGGSGSARPQGGQAEGATPDTHSQPPASGSDPSKSDNPEDGLVLSIPFDNSTLPDKGEPPVTEEGVAFDGHGATFSTDSQLAIPDTGNLGDAATGTISFCLRPQWSGDQPTDASLVNLRTGAFANRVQIAKNGQYLRFLLADNTGHESGAGVSIYNWEPGETHLVTATWGQASSSLYVDGQLVGSQSYQGEIQIPPGTPMYIGSDIPGGNPGAGGTLSDFLVYNRPLSQDEIGGLTPNCQ